MNIKHCKSYYDITRQFYGCINTNHIRKQLSDNDLIYLRLVPTGNVNESIYWPITANRDQIVTNVRAELDENTRIKSN
jgi:hypothetical protein